MDTTAFFSAGKIKIDGEYIISYTAKTKRTFTGCSGVMAHDVWSRVESMQCRTTTINGKNGTTTNETWI
jgi:hypothetical protein